MAHHSRIRGGADPWANILPSEIASLETAIARCLNGVDGGAYAPTAQLQIGGSGALVYGLTRVTRSGSLSTGNTTGTIQLQDNDVPVIDPVGNPAHANRTIVYPAIAGRGQYPYTWIARRETGGYQAWSPMFDLSDGLGPRVATSVHKLRGNDGGKLTSVTVYFRVGAPHSTLPPTMPAARVYTVDTNGNTLLCTSQKAGADAFGFVYVPTPASPLVWFNGGFAQAFTIPIDQNNLCNVASKEFVLQLVDEQGLTGWPWSLLYTQSVRVATTTNYSPPFFGLGTPVDGVTLNAGDRVLFVLQTDPTQNGIWVASSGYWTRSTDLNQDAKFQRGMVVPVTSGTVWGGIYFQANTNVTSWTRGTSPDSAKPWVTATALTAFPNACIPTPTHANGYWFVGTATGTTPSTAQTGGTEPNWPTGAGSTVIDNAGANQITWTCMGPTPTALSFLTHLDQQYPPDSSGYFTAHGLLWQAAVATYAGIPDFRPQ